MNPRLVEALQYDHNLPELKPYFDKPPFTNIQIDGDTPQATMMASGYTYNLSTKFWRVLKSTELIEAHKSDGPMCGLLLEVFTNQSLALTDILATWVNNYLKLGLSGNKLAVHNDKFVEGFKNRLSESVHNLAIDKHHDWAETKLYPYRNIIHHMGELSSAVPIDLSVICVPKESEWDFVQLRKDLKGYPSQTAYQIVTNTIKLPNMLTGDPGDSHRFESIVEFSSGWLKRLAEMVSLFVEAAVDEKAKET